MTAEVEELDESVALLFFFGGESSFTFCFTVLVVPGLSEDGALFLFKRLILFFDGFDLGWGADGCCARLDAATGVDVWLSPREDGFKDADNGSFFADGDLFLFCNLPFTTFVKEGAALVKGGGVTLSYWLFNCIF